MITLHTGHVKAMTDYATISVFMSISSERFRTRRDGQRHGGGCL